jgi:hypothetical protein
MTKYEIKKGLRRYSPSWIHLMSEMSGVSENQVRSVFSGNHRDKHGVLMYAEKLLNTVGEP